MAGVISDVVNVAVTAETAKVAQESFGFGLLASYTATWLDGLIREYSNMTEVVADFAATTVEYRAAAKYFGQDKTPERLLIGKCVLPPTQRWAVTPTAVHSALYTMTIESSTGVKTVVTYQADSATTVTEIITGLKAAIDALGLAITVSDQTTFMRVLANVAGVHFGVSAAKADGSLDANLAVAQDHADPGIATDLAALAVVRNDWYALFTTFNSKPVVDAAAAWCNTNKKLYPVQTQDTAVKDTVISGTDDVGESLKSAASTYPGCIWSKDTTDFVDLAWAGRVLPEQPGTETWKFKTLRGVTAGNYTSTQRTNLRAKNVNFYETTANVPMTEEGYAASGQYLDFTRWLDYLKARLGERLLGLLASVKKVPYTDSGMAQLQSEVEALLQTEETVYGSIDAGWAVTVPKVSTQAPADKTARIVRNLNFSCVYASAVHKVYVNGVVTL